MRNQIAVCLAILCAGCQSATRASAKPRLILWAWDRAEDLRFLKPGEAEVAGLMATIRVRNGNQEIGRRRLPLTTGSGVVMTAVVRIETDGSALPPAKEVAQAVGELTEGDFGRVQIDFDARATQIEWYRSLLREIQLYYQQERRVPQQRVPEISITALASWCLNRPWFAGEKEVRESVPMLFRMGPGRLQLLNELARRNGFSEGCRDAVGISTDEALPWYPMAGRVYIFNPRAWTREAFEQACAPWR